MSGNALYTRLVAATGLSPIFAENAVQNALTRAGVSADTLQPADIAKAAPHIERLLRTFRGPEAAQALEEVLALSR